ncbi:DUF6249 domain-containing protein [Aequorivita antarctica]|uniref:DUF6249 domain-containing protein n=1 Tax=Aequorivita antarctica TaxID=153266 RepID=A0A5C6YWH0_9FLAO|nr:DUF6249 domain-containing protein [Aequorivita antarctica]TXD71375.1 hypothetical protein ESU54_17170 [Aequorivita antarctica]
MKKLLISSLSLIAIVDAVAQNNVDQLQNNSGDPIVPLTSEPMIGIIFPILFISFLVFMLISVVKYFLEFRLKNKMIDRGMTEKILDYSLNKNDDNKFDDVIKLAILFCGLGMGLAITYLAGPINILSIAIMAFSIGLSFLTYFFYLRKRKK